MNKSIRSKENSDYLAVQTKKYKKLRIDNFFGGINGRIDQSVLSASSAAICYNFDFSSGALVCGMGIEAVGIAMDATNVWRFVKNIDNINEIIMFTGLSGDVFYIKQGNIHPLGISLSGRVCTANYRLHGGEVVLMWGENGDIAVWDGVNAAYFINDVAGIKSMDICGRLVFIAESDGETIRFTDELDPINWKSGYSSGSGADEGIIIPAEGSGRVGALISFSGYLYVFKDYGISRITLSGDVPNVTGNLLFGGRIFFDTVALCGNKIIFLSSDGLYEFDGLNAKKILGNLTGIAPAASACAAYHGGRYYLAAKYQWNDSRVIGCESTSYVNNALITYDPADGSYFLGRGMDIARIAAADDDVYVVCGRKIGRIRAGATVFGDSLIKFWKSPISDLGSENVKTLRNLHVDTTTDIVLTIYNETESKSFELNGSALPQKVRVGLRGKKLGFSVESSQTEARVARIVLIYTD